LAEGREDHEQEVERGGAFFDEGFRGAGDDREQVGGGGETAATRKATPTELTWRARARAAAKQILPAPARNSSASDPGAAPPAPARSTCGVERGAASARGARGEREEAEDEHAYRYDGEGVGEALFGERHVRSVQDREQGHDGREARRPACGELNAGASLRGRGRAGSGRRARSGVWLRRR
jgi:hypothetical protein